MSHNIISVATPIGQMVNDFLEEIRTTTDASPVFLKSARPAIADMFRTADQSLWPDMKRKFLLKAKLHNRTQKYLSDTLAHLETLSRRQSQTPVLPPKTARQLAMTKGIVVNTLIKTYGGFGPVAALRS